MGTDAETVRSKFKQLGGAEVGKFDQVQRRQDFIAKGQGVDEGFCRGACMDWIRRTIQSGHDVAYGDARKPTQTLRMGRIQLAVETKDLIAKSPVNTVTSWLREKKDWLEKKKDVDKTETQVPTSVWEVLKRMTDLPDPNSRKLTRAQFGDIYDIVTRLTVNDKEALNEGHIAWSSAVPVLDQAMDEERKKWNKEGKSKVEVRESPVVTPLQ
jgi:hypothetical protein